MKLLIVAATVAEVKPFLDQFNIKDDNFIESEKFDVLITGVGMVATAFALGQHLNKKYNLAINVGIAGSFDSAIAIGEIVNVVEDVFAELGAEDHDNFITLPTLGFGENIFYSTAKTALSLRNVKGITVNKVHGNAHSIEKVAQRFAPEIESMEGAAFLYAANQLAIPALQIRCISNYVEPRNRENWQIGLAVKNLNDWLIEFTAAL